MRLHTAGKALGIPEPIVAKISNQPVGIDQRKDTALVVCSESQLSVADRGYAALISKVAAVQSHSDGDFPMIHSVRDVDHLQNGYIVGIEPSNGFIRTLYRPDSSHNTLFVTERCNSNCLMCSQPPADKNDIPELTKRNLRLLDLVDAAPEYLCITGGEPTLLEANLFAILRKLRDRFPTTYVHMLTNGRRLAWSDFTSELAAINHPNFSVGIPLYSDDASLHDYIVQAKDAFDQTVLGLHQLARFSIEIEIRIVLHGLTIPRLDLVAEYICRNLTFVHHVSFMGMEHIGYAPRNMKELWIDPVDYQAELEAAVTTLQRFGIESRIYNLPLCVLRAGLWKFASQSISDWKNSYEPVCAECAVKSRCAGFFQWETKFQSRGIRAFPTDPGIVPARNKLPAEG
jgi:His-Xaa-Ser system radical SAM maturase HxsC